MTKLVFGNAGGGGVGGVQGNYVDVTADRSLGTNFTNESGGVIYVSASTTSLTGTTTATVNGLDVAYAACLADAITGIGFFVPAGGVYQINNNAVAGALNTWLEAS